MSTRSELREQILGELRKIVTDTLSDENVRIYLFGSWARKEEKHSSDIDVAVECIEPITPNKWQELSERVEESTIPYHVDIIDLNTASSSLEKNIKKEGIIWKDCMKGELLQKKHLSLLKSSFY
ncbi:putative nucleotidyltransferase [Evansella vedderi]|uniref:Nucleotidyltransferase n=1 Tax=Evansella vedderi TaxID=38282 RepID=A0ABT9ZRC3_9BACI|nr:nucleotidyltransferase domain-containing protein [Evansella vedderi]MDQ0253419.1 putative nucleotidyltransferase [Evansella vedderi]